MKQKSSVSLPGLWILVLLLGSSGLAQEKKPPDSSRMEIGEDSEGPSVQLIGWSPDEQRYAFRVLIHHVQLDSDRSSAEAIEEAEQADKANVGHTDADGFCKGYVDHQGKRFKGALQLLVFERDQRLLSLPIQDDPRCTSPQVAAERLAEAKKKLAELGVDLTQPGRELLLVSRKRLTLTPKNRPTYALEYVNKVKETAPKPDDPYEITRKRGVLELNLHRGSKKQTVLTRKVDREYSKNMGGVQEDVLTRAYVAPSGERGVVLGSVTEGMARSGYTTVIRVAAVWGWPESPPAQGP